MLNVSLRHFPSLLSSPSAHPSTLQLEEVDIIAQARPLAGVSLANWPTQPKTLVMGAQPCQPPQLHGSRAHADDFPRRPPRFEELRRHRSDSHLSRRDDQVHKHPTAASIQPQLADQCSVASGNRMQITCRVVLAIRKLGQKQNLLRQRFLVHSRKGKEKRSRLKRCAFVERDHLQKILERKVDSAVRGELLSQQK